MYTDAYLAKFVLPEDLMQALKNSNCLCYPETKEQLIEMCYGPTHSSKFDVCYSIDGKGLVKEAEVVRCKNGTAVNFMEDYMRRRKGNEQKSLVFTDRLDDYCAQPLRPLASRPSTGTSMPSLSALPFSWYR